MLSFLLVTISIFILCAETHPTFQIEMDDEHYARYYGISVEDLHSDWYGENISDSNGTRQMRNDSEFYQNHENLLVPFPTFVTIDHVLLLLFTIETVVRFVFCPRKSRFFADGLNIVDILSVMPYYVNLAVEAVSVKEAYSSGSIVDALFVLKVFRIFRVLRLLRHYKGMQVLLLTVKHSWTEMLLLVVLLFISIIIFSALIYFANHDEQFSSIPTCFWWVIIT